MSLKVLSRKIGEQSKNCTVGSTGYARFEYSSDGEAMLYTVHPLARDIGGIVCRFSAADINLKFGGLPTELFETAAVDVATFGHPFVHEPELNQEDDIDYFVVIHYPDHRLPGIHQLLSFAEND